MPHVVLTGAIHVDDIFPLLEPVLIRNQGGILKTDAMYISRDKSSILIESLAIEEGKKRSFFTLIGQRDDGFVIRIYPGSDVEKTAGVKSILSEIAKQLIGRFPQVRIGETNLMEFLK
ncbi:MAG: hypothetical protein MUC80_01420 [Candidatus Thermoplasmatota archaeon]|nr:hypothetical protein [Candidatus Thermoplasmatota archaeon]